MTIEADVAVIGAGPVGLAFATTLAERGITVAVLERASAASLAEPASDGREIALTHRSIANLKRLGAWARLPADAISPLRAARVIDGASPYALRFDPDPAGDGPLGMLVANRLIRQSLYAEAVARPGLHLLTESPAARIRRGPQEVVVEATTGTRIRARLAVAADTRFSAMRQAQGISVAREEFGTSMLLCRMTHAVPHAHVAWERFGYGQTIATLPMNGLASSIVITRRSDRIAELAALDVPAFEAAVTRGVKGALGAMRLDGQRHVAPLVGTHARRFVASRFALIGDAAVGMHPVTALGFNLGLSGQDLLAREIAAAVARGADIADPAALRRYEAAHSRLTWPIWLGTNLVARLYALESWPARLARQAALRVANRLPPFRHAVTRLLMDPSPA